MIKSYQIRVINYEDIKYDTDDDQFFNFQFEAPQKGSLDDQNSNDFWFKVSHLVHQKVISNYPTMRRSLSVGNKNIIELKRQNQFKYFLKYVAEKKTCSDNLHSTTKK
ncbi:unnamed protein product (macronuclear) [Paramecium tetraurelia]|uniref:PX domain-containing protein n=1 Tax=Paramecium tetraurelia TaxID=5888 RepID=A0CBP6_PARTE|nr:uncharacterized protein GSPATT00036996001 [Paramecium tetraurelia]CAK68213.1 unnamed protein product [Paramecium tetraurelia]|eukprot:XP_001435610.1 hypothetical protein (macronuclear) [Paramecium tetraurelia strain d4-2]